ncbi:Mo-dependent nitrogenase C-terminal domain-containing protein [Leptolyngbya sp. FACHB-261]|uniref:Mo-dependent nitrogenase C-terminal domain-containing protein n=1 Tax=Leptolyngbya sp. FACHB-261 TaxID=2692806 RepID=UPI0016860443|nr:Mo-dependent nitrogenase C-terminal domain-containing protein [Leptolyngbya sp. FACHB-261]MBD2101982.1 nitrogenase [Leptolyngbya sp. FACHB-261]
MCPPTSTYSSQQISAWLRGLLAVAWADGDFSLEEQQFIAAITRDELADDLQLETLKPISPAELAAALGSDQPGSSDLAQNFLRTAVMTAVADGFYSEAEDELLHRFCDALGQTVDALQSLRVTLEPRQVRVELATVPPAIQSGVHSDVLQPVRNWLDGMDVQDPRIARFLCRLIPAQCPFERDVKLFGHRVVHIPPMCKLNPLYEQLVGLRFRSLCYLAEQCGEDVAQYC